ncbi:MAG TPA: hypothetical protein VEJ45_00730 [Candidatus Acidoferrales bacterium]|nr:hypothetical protein [Candidatus Acidoferrales bacterium]
MPTFPGKRAIVVAAVLACIAAAVGGWFLYRWHRPWKGARAGTAPEILTHVPADAPVIAYIDVAALRRLQDSPLTAIVGLAGQNPRQDPDYENFVRNTGFDYTRDLDHVAVAFWPSFSLKTTPKGADNRALAVADGRFDEGKIKAYALRSGTTITLGERSFYIVPGDPDVAFEFRSPTRMALASGTDGVRLLSQPDPASRGGPTEERIDRVAGAPLFAVARTDNLPASLYENLRGVPQLQTLARSVRGLVLAGQPDGEVIHLTLDAECDSMTSALELATVVDSLRLLGSMALADPKARPQMTKPQVAFLSAVLNQAQLTHEDRWVRLSLDVTPAMLGEQNAQMRGGRPSKASSSKTRIPSLVRALGL